MELCREESTISSERRLYKYGALVLIFASLTYEVYQTMVFHKLSLMGLGYSCFFLFLWCWRCLFSYTYILTDSKLLIEKKGLGFTSCTTVNLADTASFTNNYVRSFFRKTKISQYQHLYAATDPRPQRLLVYTKDGRLIGLLFKVSDGFLATMAKTLPDKFLDFQQ